jgi:hypothetical protein
VVRQRRVFKHPSRPSYARCRLVRFSRRPSAALEELGLITRQSTHHRGILAHSTIPRC